MKENTHKTSSKFFQEVLSTFPLDKKLKIDLFKMLKLPKTTIRDSEASQYSFLKKLLQIETRPNAKLFDSYAIHPDNLKEVMDNMKFYITSTKMGVPYISAESKYTTSSGMEVPKRYCILSKGTKAPEGYNAVFLDSFFKDAFDKQPADETLLYMAKDVKRRIEYLTARKIDVPYSYWKFIESAVRKFRIDQNGKTSKDNIRAKKVLYPVQKKDGTTENESFSSVDLLHFYLEEKSKNASSFLPPTYMMPKTWLKHISPVEIKGRTENEGKKKKVELKFKEGHDTKQFIWEFHDFLRDLHPRISTFTGEREGENIKVYVFPSETFGNITFVEGDRFKGDKRARRTYVLFGEDYDSMLQQDIGKLINATHNGELTGRNFGIRINHDKESKNWKNKVRWLVQGDYLAKSPFVGRNKRILEEMIGLKTKKRNKGNPEGPSFDE